MPYLKKDAPPDVLEILRRAEARADECWQALLIVGGPANVGVWVLRPKKAEQLNQELCKAGAYAMGDQKQITAWLELRNKAAHAEYGAYDTAQVELMLRGVGNFIVRVPK